jgi:hypothetical protein
MPKRLGVFGVGAAVLALVISVVVPATSDEKARQDRRVILRLAEVAADDEEAIIEVDVEDDGFPTVGDYVVFGGDPVYKRDRKTQVGVLRGDCLFVEVLSTTVTLECDVSFNLRRGLITVEGPVTFRPTPSTEPSGEEPSELAVTGGTDAYKTAHGELKIHFSEEIGRRVGPGGALFTFRLILH